jgi:EAL domain-containing protein (putative c-di-GMP-specific phosphodiesterase class I)
MSPMNSVGTPRVISRAIVELGRALGVAEGIESETQASWFSSLGCQYGQGFYFAEPLDPDEADAYLADHWDVAAPHGITTLASRRQRVRATAGE